MHQTLITSGEAPNENVERLRKPRCTLSDLLTFVAAIPVCIGVVAAVEYTAYIQSSRWIEFDWHSAVRCFLIDDVGVPSRYVCRYVSFAMIDLPAWVCYSAIALTVGLIRSKWSFAIGVAFVLSIFAWDLMSDYFAGLHVHINLRIVSLFGVALAGLCFAGTRIIRGRSHVPGHRNGRIAMESTWIAIVATLAVSIYGGWLIGLSRKAGVEVQEMMRDALLSISNQLNFP